MRVSQAEKEKTRARIVSSAARMLRERGVDGASLADVMQDAGHTHGGFYRHFDSKDALVAAALDQAFDQILSPLSGEATARGQGDALERFVQSYLSQGHVDHPGQGCPIPTLAADVGRASPAVQARFTAGVGRLVEQLAPVATERTAAWRQLAMMAGAVMLARATDDATAAEILSACQKPDGSTPPDPARLAPMQKHRAPRLT